ncbi:hypothetical protein SK128_006873 [Halocaridina rubra]|uniref:Uncharacterized protein n=1 Tax=Halocaridina rubra TaxID=373956 RepID=A0AAN9A2S3_HALRR
MSDVWPNLKRPLAVSQAMFGRISDDVFDRILDEVWPTLEGHLEETAKTFCSQALLASGSPKGLEQYRHLTVLSPRQPRVLLL